MKILFMILLILIGSVLVSLTIDHFGTIANIIKNLIGVGCLVGGIFIGRSKKRNQQSS